MVSLPLLVLDKTGLMSRRDEESRLRDDMVALVFSARDLTFCRHLSWASGPGSSCTRPAGFPLMNLTQEGSLATSSAELSSAPMVVPLGAARRDRPTCQIFPHILHNDKTAAD